MHEEETEEETQVNKEQDIARRVIYALLLPAVRVGYMFHVPIKEMGDLFQMAYYHETKRRGLKMREASKTLDVSMRKVALLSKRLKRNFLDTEIEHGLPRQLEFMLWGGSLSELRLCQAMPDEEPDAIKQALALLVKQGRVQIQSGRTVTYEVVKPEARLVQGAWAARIDGLNVMMTSVVNAVYGRFFKQEPSAFARTLSLRIREQDVPKLRVFYEEVMFPMLRDLERDAKDDEDAESMDISLIWAPYAYITKRLAEDERLEKEHESHDTE